MYVSVNNNSITEANISYNHVKMTCLTCFNRVQNCGQNGNNPNIGKTESKPVKYLQGEAIIVKNVCPPPTTNCSQR